MNINPDSVKDKINFYYYINSKERVIQLFKDNKKIIVLQIEARTAIIIVTIIMIAIVVIIAVAIK